MTTRAKQICWSCLLFVMLGVVVVWLMSSCINTNMDDVKRIPPVEFTTDVPHQHAFTRRDLGYHFGHSRGKNNVTIQVPRDVQIVMLDTNFKEVDYFWFRRFNTWFQEMKHNNGILSMGNGQNMDCDNFAMLYKSLASVASYKAGVTQEPAVALMMVTQVSAFGGVPAGGLHMVNLIMTSQGWYVLEPQTGHMVLLEQYPNQSHVSMIIF